MREEENPVYAPPEPENGDGAGGTESAAPGAGPDETSTVFGDPVSHNGEPPKKKSRNRVLIVIAAAIIAAAVIGGTVAVVKLIPVKESGTSSGAAVSDIPVVEYTEDDIDALTVENANGRYRLIAERTEESSSGSSGGVVNTLWLVDGVDRAKTESGSISAIASAAASVTATRKITSKTPEQCGLNAPVYKIDVESKKVGNYTLTVGGESPDGLGVYLSVSTDGGIYLVDGDEVADFDFTILDLAETSTVAGIDMNDGVDDYTDGNGNLTSFDSLTVSGSNFPVPVTFRKANAEEAAMFYSYMVSSPSEREAAHVDELLSAFTNGLSCSGAYAMDVSAKSLAEFKLNNPYLTVAIKVGSRARTFRIAKIDDEFCAVIADDSILIKKVPASDMPFLDYKTEDYYGRLAFLRPIDSLTEFKVETGGATYTFKVVYDDSEDAEEDLAVSINGAKINAEYFQSMYQAFLNISYVDFITGTGSKTADMRITLSYSDKKTKDVITYSKSNETSYDFTLNGKSQGRITASAYNRLSGAVKSVANNKKP